MAFVAPTSMVLAQYAVAEGGEHFPEFLEHIKRLYPEVYGPAIFIGWVPERRELLLG